MDAKAVQGWIKAARDAKGWTQETLGEKLGVTKANVSHWETGKHDPSFLQLLKIRDLTGHPLREVLPAQDWPLPQIGREKITSLGPDQLAALQAGISGILVALSTPVPAGKRRVERAA